MSNAKSTLTDEELRTFFNDNQELMQSIATQLIPLCEETDLYLLRETESGVLATDGDLNEVSLDAQLRNQLEQYFDAAGTRHPSRIFLQSPYYPYNTTVIKFSFNLGVGHDKGIIYVTDSEMQDEWERYEKERLEKEWFIFEDIMPAPPKRWSRLPNWLQWIIYYVFFGWAWM